MRAAIAVLALFVTTTGMAPPAFAWGATGHRLIGRVAILSLPKDLPQFLKTPEAVWDVGEMAREPDRWRAAGQPHDNELDTGHFVDMDDNGKIEGILPLADLPATREAYDTALRAGGVTQYKAGTLPYSIMIGFQQLRTDFAYWRADVAGRKFAKSKAERAWFEKDRKLHEKLSLRDLGVWAHFVGDASQPMHVSVHHDGWGTNTPNPEGFVVTGGIHAKFEGTFVRAHIAQGDVASHIPAPRDCNCRIEDETKTYLARSLALLIPTYRFDKQGAFDGAGNAEGKEFVATQLGAGAGELRDLIAEAWRQSATVSIGYPAIPVPDIESGKANALGSLQGLD